MRKILTQLLACLSLLHLLGCGDIGGFEIVGKWVVVNDSFDDPQMLDFREDGKVIVSEPDGDRAGRWEVDADGNISYKLGEVDFEYDLIEKKSDHLAMSQQGLGRGKMVRFYRMEAFRNMMTDINSQAPAILESIDEISDEDRLLVDLSRLKVVGTEASITQKFQDGREFQLELSLDNASLAENVSYERWSLKRFSLSEPPELVGEKFLIAMKIGDYETAKKYATKDAQASIEMMAGMAGDGGTGGNPDDIQIGRIEGEGDRRTLHYTDAGRDMTLNLRKERGEWKAAWEKGGPEG